MTSGEFDDVGHGGLGGEHGDVNRVHDHARAKGDEVQAKEVRAMSGLSEDGPSLSGGLISRYGDTGRDEGPGRDGKGKRAAERMIRDVLLADMYARLHEEIAATRQRIGVLEDRLRDEFGDNFLDDNARMYLGDDMPQRPPGMSDANWNKHLHGKLADKMLNPDGSIKDEYAHLDIAKWLAEQARLAKLEAQSNRLVAGAEQLAEGGLSPGEASILKARLERETLATLRKAELSVEPTSLKESFRNSVMAKVDVDRGDVAQEQKGDAVLASFGVDLGKV